MGCRVKLMDINTKLKYKMVCHFKLAVDIVENGIREFVYDMDKPVIQHTWVGINSEDI